MNKGDIIEAKYQGEMHKWQVQHVGHLETRDDRTFLHVWATSTTCFRHNKGGKYPVTTGLMIPVAA